MAGGVDHDATIIVKRFVTNINWQADCVRILLEKLVERVKSSDEAPMRRRLYVNREFSVYFKAIALLVSRLRIVELLEGLELIAEFERLLSEFAG